MPNTAKKKEHFETETPPTWPQPEPVSEPDPQKKNAEDVIAPDKATHVPQNDKLDPSKA
jgi:hypothetical protein